MDEKELAELPLLNSDRLREALHNKDKEKSAALAEKIGKEFLAIHKNLWSTAEDLFHFLHDIFSEAQKKSAEEIESDIGNENYEAVSKKLEHMRDEHLRIHDLYLEIIEALQGALSEVFGEEYLYQALRYTAEKKKPWFERVIKLSPEDLARHSVNLVKLHTGNCRITEDAEKYTFTMDPCGSGGRLWRRETRGGLKKEIYLTDEPHPQNLKKAGLPAYCAHCPVWNSIMPVEWFGYPMWVYELPESAFQPCKIHIYKNPDNIPDEYYQLLGTSNNEQ